MSLRHSTLPAPATRPSGARSEASARRRSARQSVRGLVAALVAALGAAWLGACVSAGPDGSGRASVRTEVEAPTAGVALEALDLRVELDPDRASLAGRAVLSLVAEAARVEWLPLELHGLEIRAVRGPDAVDLAYSHQDGELAVQLREPLAAGERCELAVEYGGQPGRGLSFASGAHLDGTYAWVDGRPGSGAWWFPTVPSPGNRFDARLELALPAGWRAAGFGRELEPDGDPDVDADGEVQVRFASVSPLTADELAFAAGPFAVERRPTAQVAVWGAPQERAALARAADEAERARMFARVFLDGPEAALDPSGELNLVHAPEAARSGSGGRRLGFLADLGLATVSAEALEREATAHFAPATWRDVWIGPAVGRQALAAYAERLGGAEARAEVLERWETRVARERPEGQAGALLPPPGIDPLLRADEPWRAPYGALVLELVRGQLGAERFEAALRALTLRARSYPTSTETLFELFGPAGDPALAVDWRQWVERPGQPELEVAWEHDAEADEVRLRVRQEQLGEAGVPRVYRFPVLVEVASGARIEVHRIEVDERVETVRLPAEELPKWVRFDVEGWLPARIDERKDLAEWFAISTDTRRSIGRVRAVEALAERARRAPRSERSLYLTHFRGRLDRDPSPRARRAAAQALGALGGEAAERWLRTAAAEDDQASVRTAALDALGELADDAVTDLAGFAERRAESDPECVAAALRLRAAAEPGTAGTYLRALFARGASEPQERAASLAALATLEGAELETLLIGRASDRSEAVSVRVAAIEGLGERWTASPDTIERVARLLDDPAVAVREAALSTLTGWRGVIPRTVLEARLPRAVDPTEQRVIEAALGATP